MLPKSSGKTPAPYSESTRSPDTGSSAIDFGSIRIDGKLFAAPMAGYSDRITRSIALEHGADLAYTEMISAEALVRGSQRTLDMLKRAPNEGILAAQLFGSDPETLGRAARIAALHGANIIDLNAGCPVPKVTRKGAGAALANSPNKIAEALESMASAGVPVTVKIRSGWDDASHSWRQQADMAVKGGAAAIGFHPRTRDQGYGGKADWSLIADLVEQVSIPIIGSGDLYSSRDVLDMMEFTGCAGVMIARGAVGNPWIFADAKTAMRQNGGESEPPSPGVRLRMALRHLEEAAAAFSEATAAREMKKHLAGYIKGWPGAAEIRRTLLVKSSFDALREGILESVQSIAYSE